MSEIKHDGKKYLIAEDMQTLYPELIKLVLKTESMDQEEKQYWFDIMPSMTNEQTDRLFNILETEKRKLEELEIKYQEEIKDLNEKHLIEWQDFQMKEGKKKIAAEQEADDTEDAEDVLDMLNDL